MIVVKDVVVVNEAVIDSHSIVLESFTCHFILFESQAYVLIVLRHDSSTLICLIP
jgi:hypothetical protein